MTTSPRPVHPDARREAAGAPEEFGAVLAVIVSFNGGSKLQATVDALQSQVSHIHIVDNASGEATSSILKGLEARPGISVTWLPENRGIGAALNLGVAFARAGGYTWVLTMDQDSQADPGMVHAFQAVIRQTPSLTCLTPSLVVHGQPGKAHDEEVPYAITSGNLVKLTLFDTVGLYNEAFFIDCVDFDFCLRLRAKGHRIVRVGQARLHHELGDPQPTQRPFSRFYTQHSPLRRYYMFRNFIYLWISHFKLFPLFLSKLLVAHLILFILIIFYDPSRYIAYIAIFKGIGDAIKNKNNMNLKN